MPKHSPFFISIFIANIFTMTTTDIKRELHEYIEDADDRLLRILYGVVLSGQESHEVPEWHKTVLTERLEDYQKNPGNVISWEDLKTKIEKMR
jgi:hypothetical protein